MDNLTQFEDLFEFTRRYGFRFVGLNPYFECKSPANNRNKLINGILFHCCFWIVTVTVVLELIFVFTIFGDMEQYMEFCKTLSGMAYDLMGAELLLLMWTSGTKFNEFILELEEMFPSDQGTQLHYGVKEQAKSTEITLKTIFGVFMLCLSVWVVTPAYDLLHCYLTGTKYVLVLPYTIWMPPQMNETASSVTAMLLVVLTMYAVAMIIVSVNMLYVSIVSQIELQFEILAQNIRNLPPNDSLALCQTIQQHIRLINICQHFSKLISRSVFLNQLLSTLGICCGLFELALSDEIFQYIVYLFAMVIQNFTLSFIGDRIMCSVSNAVACSRRVEEDIITSKEV